MKGFTLIELLVVVLIIGVLTSIALPQYELVVEKARASEAMINAKAIVDACQRHIQEFPNDTCDNRSKIADVQLKGGSWNDAGTCFKTKKFVYDLGSTGGNLYVGRSDSPNCADGSGDVYAIEFDVSGNGDRIAGSTNCGSDSDYYQVCKLFTAN